MGLRFQPRKYYGYKREFASLLFLDTQLSLSLDFRPSVAQHRCQSMPIQHIYYEMKPVLAILEAQ